MRLLGLVLLVGCYSPNEYANQCNRTCEVDGVCPDGLGCIDGVCRATPDNCDTTTADAGHDAPLGMNSICLGTFVKICFDERPTEDFNIAAAAIISTTDCAQIQPPPLIQPQTQVQPQNQIQPAGPDLCVIAARNIQITAPLRVMGSRPLVLFAAENITIAATVSVNSVVKSGMGIAKGAGAQTGPCNGAGSGTAGGGIPGGGGGGAGGALLGTGGEGGLGSETNQGGPMVSMVAAPYHVVRGGCAGGNGGSGSANGPIGGQGGGGVFFLAGKNIQVTDAGKINASGSGGGEPGIGANRAGGAGGGSGGFIGFEADTDSITVHLNAELFALGGSGGTGGALASPGRPGVEAMSPTMFTPIPIGGCSGGGAGAAVNGAMGGNAGVDSCGGGGGGGGGGLIGFVDVLPTENPLKVQPPARLLIPAPP